MVGVSIKEIDYIYKRMLSRLSGRGYATTQNGGSGGGKNTPQPDEDEEPRIVLFDVQSFDNSFQKEFFGNEQE